MLFFPFSSKNENGANYLIKREILKSEKRSIWSLNGKQTTFSEVKFHSNIEEFKFENDTNFTDKCKIFHMKIHPC